MRPVKLYTLTMGRMILLAAAALLLATAGIHAMGLPMASSWGEALGRQEHLAICLLWLQASVSWGVTALIWAATATRFQSWRGAATLSLLVPAHGAVGVLYIDPTFFGGYMLAASVALATIGLIVLRRS